MIHGESSFRAIETNLATHGLRFGAEGLTLGEFIRRELDAADNRALNAHSTLLAEPDAMIDERDEMEIEIEEGLLLNQCLGSVHPDVIEVALCRSLADHLRAYDRRLTKESTNEVGPDLFASQFSVAEDTPANARAQLNVLARFKVSATAAFEDYCCTKHGVPTQSFASLAGEARLRDALLARATRLEEEMEPPRTTDLFPDPNAETSFQAAVEQISKDRQGLEGPTV